MARPPTWLQEIPRIKRTLSGTQQSHFGRAHVADLFGLKDGAAGDLMELLPRMAWCGAHGTTREELLRFVDEVLEADDVPALFARRREENKNASRRRPRVLVPTNRLGQGLASLPATVTLTRGRLTVDFRELAELVEALAIVASNLEGDAEWAEFKALYEPVPDRVRGVDDEARDDVLRLFAELEEMEGASRRSGPRSSRGEGEAAHG